MDRTYLAILAVGFSLSQQFAFSTGAASQSLASLTSSADAIIVGEILDGAFNLNVATLRVRVQKSLKGSVRAPNVLTVEARSPGTGIVNDRIDKDRGIFFLKRSTGGVWLTIPLVSGGIPDLRRNFVFLPPTSEPKRAPNGFQLTTREKVIAEILGSLDSAEAQSQTVFVDLSAEYRARVVPHPL